MDHDLLVLGEDLVTTAARVVRWVPKSTEFGLSLAAVRLLARLSDHGTEQLAEMRHSLGTSVAPMLASMSRRDQKALREGIEAMRRLMALTDTGPADSEETPGTDGG